MAHRAVASLIAFLVLALLAPTADAADVLTQHNDNARTGTNLQENTLTRNSVRSSSFGKLWMLYADGQVVAQPLYVSGLAIDTTRNPDAPHVQGTFNPLLKLEKVQ